MPWPKPHLKSWTEDALHLYQVLSSPCAQKTKIDWEAEPHSTIQLPKIRSTFSEQMNRWNFQKHICNERQPVCPYPSVAPPTALSPWKPHVKDKCRSCGAPNSYNLEEGFLLRKRVQLTNAKLSFGRSLCIEQPWSLKLH